jgi:hypothetical protein
MTDLFSDIDVDPDEILGRESYSGLYSPEKAEERVPVNVLTGERSTDLPPVEEAKEFAEDSPSDAPYVAKLRSRESIAETGGKPYSKCVFCHFSLVGSLDLHRAYLRAYRSDQFDVEIGTDYDAGEVTITVAQQ